MKNMILLAALSVCLASAQTRLLRHPTYHQGKVAFSYQGDIWAGNEDGSGLTRLTNHKARETNPRFSPDGKWIAFTANRYGSADVYLIPASGGEAKQLTFHSAADQVVGWSRDGKRVLFSSTRGDGAFPSIGTLYEVAVEGGMEKPIKTDWGSWGSWSPDGTKLAFTRHPASTRKHYRGSFAADLWVMDVSAKSYRPLTDPEFKGAMAWPMYGSRGEIYFVADRLPNEKSIQFGGPEVMKSTNNIWKISEKGGKPEQVTKHTSGSLFFPSISADGKTIVYEENHGLWKLDTASGKTTELSFNIVADEKENEIEWKPFNSTATSYHLSPSGRRAAIVAHGEIFTIATDRGEPQRVTRSFRRDGAPLWSPNGKWIAYISDESGREEVWLSDELGKNRRKITDSDTEKRGMSWSHDSKSLLVGASDRKLWRINVETGAASVVAEGETGAPTNARFSPDDQWISYTRMDRDMRPHVYVRAASGGEEHHIGVDDLFSATAAYWTPDGRKLVLQAGTVQAGMASLGRPSNVQLYAVALNKEDRDPLDRGIDSEEEAAAQAPQRPAGMGMQGGSGAPAKVEVKIDWDGLPKRIRQVTRLQDSVQSVAISPDSRQYAFVTSSQSDGRFVSALYTISENGDRMTRVAVSQPPAAGEDGPPGPGGPGGFGGGISSPQYTRDGRALYFMEGGGIYSITPPSTADAAPAAAAATPGAGPGGGTPPRRRVNFAVRVEVDLAEQREQVFDEVWRVMKHRFYDPKMHGVNWAQMKDTYSSLLKYVSDDDELAVLAMEMIGELNASHTGVTPPGSADRTLPTTRYPGFDLVEDASGYFRVGHIYRKGPADKDFLKIAPGHYVIAVNDTELKTSENYWKHFTLADSRRWTFLLNDKPSRDGAWHVEIQPISGQAFNQLAYEKWVRDREQMVHKLTNGEIGYLHIQAMNAPSLRKFELDLAENRFKKALIIDQRFNGGGGIDQELLRILNQKKYQSTQRRDSIVEERPQQAFFGPMVVMQNERSASDAEMFPDGFRALGLGKIVGVPTLGAVIGTGSYGLLNGGQMRTPGVGVYNSKGINMENYGVPPDVYVDNTPADFASGRDAQIEKAIEVLRAEIAAKSK